DAGRGGRRGGGGVAGRPTPGGGVVLEQGRRPDGVRVRAQVVAGEEGRTEIPGRVGGPAVVPPGAVPVKRRRPRQVAVRVLLGGHDGVRRAVRERGRDLCHPVPARARGEGEQGA